MCSERCSVHRTGCFVYRPRGLFVYWKEAVSCIGCCVLCMLLYMYYANLHLSIHLVLVAELDNIHTHVHAKTPS